MHRGWYLVLISCSLGGMQKELLLGQIARVSNIDSSSLMRSASAIPPEQQDINTIMQKILNGAVVTKNDRRFKELDRRWGNLAGLYCVIQMISQKQVSPNSHKLLYPHLAENDERVRLEMVDISIDYLKKRKKRVEKEGFTDIDRYQKCIGTGSCLCGLCCGLYIAPPLDMYCWPTGSILKFFSGICICFGGLALITSWDNVESSGIQEKNRLEKLITLLNNSKITDGTRKII